IHAGFLHQQVSVRCSKTPSPLCPRSQSGDDREMRWLFQPLLMLVAKSSQSDLAHQVEYLKAENQMLRKRLGKRPYLTEPEKRLLVKLGQAVGKGITALLTIVSYPTYRRWV